MRTNLAVLQVASALLVAGLIGCAENSTAPEKLVASRMEAASPTNISAVAGTSVDPPSVVVRDQNGSPMKGVSVQFRIVFGAGTLIGTDVVTDESGKATVGGWILPRLAGLNTVAAMSGSLRVDFVANGHAGPPAGVVKQSGDEQLGPPGSVVSFPQTVMVQDENGNPVAGSAVTFSVEGGGGSLAAASTIPTDSSGIARFAGWTLGSEGAQSLSATVAGLPPVTFTAIIATDPCSSFRQLSDGSSSNIALSGFACPLPDGRLANFFAYNAPQSHAYMFWLDRSTFDGVLTVTTKDGTPVAEATPSLDENAPLKALLPKGDYVVRVTPTSIIERGGEYQLSASPTSEDVSGCEEMFITVGTTTSQSLGKGDCQPGGEYADRFRIYLTAGTTVTVTMSSDDVDNSLSIGDSGGYVYNSTSANSLYDGVYGARLIFTAGKNDYYVISATTVYGGGDYTLSVK